MRPSKAKDVIAVLWLLVAMLILGMAVGVQVARADYENCVHQPWYRGEILRWTQRYLCDGPIYADGSWLRARNFYSPEYYVPFTCSRYSCYGGYWVGEYDSGIETYVVTPDTILPDEPGHIG